MGAVKTFYEKILPDMALNFVILTAKNLLERQTVRSAISGQARKILTGNREKPYEMVPRVEHYADKIMEALNDRGISPTNICVDGLPGSGKSSLGRALAERCNLKWRTLYWQELRGAYPFKQGRIYENIRLMRTQDMEDFYYNEFLGEKKHIGVKIVRVIVRYKIDVLSTSNIGDISFHMLKDNLVDIYKAEEDLSVKEIVESYRLNQLRPLTSPTHSVEESQVANGAKRS